MALFQLPTAYPQSSPRLRHLIEAHDNPHIRKQEFRLCATGENPTGALEDRDLGVRFDEGSGLKRGLRLDALSDHARYMVADGFADGFWVGGLVQDRE